MDRDLPLARSLWRKLPVETLTPVYKSLGENAVVEGVVPSPPTSPMALRVGAGGALPSPLCRTGFNMFVPSDCFRKHLPRNTPSPGAPRVTEGDVQTDFVESVVKQKQQTDRPAPCLGLTPWTPPREPRPLASGWRGPVGAPQETSGRVERAFRRTRAGCAPPLAVTAPLHDPSLWVPLCPRPLSCRTNRVTSRSYTSPHRAPIWQSALLAHPV